MNTYSQNSYRLHEYFSVSRGPLFSNGKHKILVNEGAIRHFTGRAQKVLHGVNGLIDVENGDLRNYNEILFDRVDLGIKNETIIVPKQDYSPTLLVGDGDKLYLRCSSSLVAENMRLPIVNEDPNLEAEYKGIGRMVMRSEIFNEFTVDYSVEAEYIDSFESDNISTTFNFLIAEFYKTGNKLIKKQRHSGIIFLPRIFRLKKPN